MSNTSFSTKLTGLVNEYSKENDSNTPDFILVQFIEGCLHTFNIAVQQRENWYGRDPRPSEIKSRGEDCENLERQSKTDYKAGN